MKISRQQVEEDIKKGKSTAVYYSSQTLWWTHLDSDVKESSEKGKEVQVKLVEKQLEGDISEANKTMIKAHIQRIKDGSIPLDPTGAPMFKIDNPIQWFEKADDEPGHFGKHGVNALMKAHHQNIGNEVPRSWDEVNAVLDAIEAMDVNEEEE